MKNNVKPILAALLASLMLVGTIACTGTGTPQETDSKEGVGTEEGTTAGVTDATESEAENESLTGDFTVSEKDGVASITTATGLSYDATGYESVDAKTGIIKFKGDMLLTLTSEVVSEPFNRFTMTYSSDKPLEVYVKYTTREQEELFYLEAGTGDFSAVLGGFLSKQHRRQFTSIRVEPCQAGWVNFSLSALSTECIEAPEQTHFLENDRLKLGIALHWGGAISYLEDKSCTVEGLTNLVNRHDTGRLIQQSYYGTLGEDNSYEPGMSFGSVWHYNPVQGGDQHGVGGRIIDVRITDTSVYIKSQPCDWAKNGSYTPFYTENTYTMEEDHIRVDNRCVDFSGWEHPHHGQETPAMYTVSYLDTFACYNGDKPWTGDDLTICRDLPFWDHGRQIVYFNEKNTETWYAWYSEEDNVGIGVYVPGIDTVGGGQSQPGVRDKSDMGDSTSFGAGWNILRMKAFEPLEYSYLLTAGSLETIRDTFTAHKEFTANPDLREDRLPQEAPYMPTTPEELEDLDLRWAAKGFILVRNAEMVYDTDEGALKLTTVNDDAFIVLTYGSTGVQLNAEDYTTFKVEYKILTTNKRDNYAAELYPCAGDTTEPSAGNLMWLPGLVKDGEYHTLTVDLTKSVSWSGEVHLIRFDHFNGSEPGDVMYIKSITLE